MIPQDPEQFAAFMRGETNDPGVGQAIRGGIRRPVPAPGAADEEPAMKIVHEFRYDTVSYDVAMLVCMSETVVDGAHYGVFFAVPADSEPPEGPERDRFRQAQQEFGEVTLALAAVWP